MPNNDFDDFLFRQEIEEAAPFVADLIRWEDERQARKLIFIPSQSYVPQAVRDALGTRFQNLYAEGYPPSKMVLENEEGLRDIAWHLANYRRYADRRFYKGKEYANILECLAQRKAAQIFATEDVSADQIYVNVQALSGTPANLGVYWSLMKPGDTFMGLDLYQGGHLSHGSEFNISGQRYNVISYGVDPATERLDYDAIRDLALKHHPKIIVAGYTSYPWAPDWGQFREIADDCGAFLMADISHVAGMAVAGVYPNPVGIADVVTFTTHKTLMGPRGAVVMTTDEEIAGKIDLAIFPGEQGGPHVNKFAAMAVAFELAKSDQFKTLQHQIVKNAKALAEGFIKRGVRLAYGGTDTHLLLLDLKSIPVPSAQPTGLNYPIWGEPAVRILDLAGMVANKNTIPGDLETPLATGIRLGTPWLTQRGLAEKDMDSLAGLMHKLLSNLKPFVYQGLAGMLPRAKVDLNILEEVRSGVADIAGKAGIDLKIEGLGYPHYQDIEAVDEGETHQIKVIGFRARQFLDQLTSSNLMGLAVEEKTISYFLNSEGTLLAEVEIQRVETDSRGRNCYLISSQPAETGKLLSWMRGISDGYICFDQKDFYRKVEGPVILELVEGQGKPYQTEMRAGSAVNDLYQGHPEYFDLSKPYFIGQDSLRADLPAGQQKEWVWDEKESPLKKTELYAIHQELGGKLVPFAGWEMPVRYSSVREEHQAVRKSAGLFDVAHMGVFEISGPNATPFLDLVFSNYAAWLDDGQSLYGYFLKPDGSVIDDGIIYRVSADYYYLVINASNEEKDWDWLNAVNDGKVVIDLDRPGIKVEAPAVIRNLKDPASGKAQKRDLALQGPRSLDILQDLTADPAVKRALSRLRRTELMSCELSGIPLVVARTGYTGENWGFEILVHPEQMGKLWNLILEAGDPFGVKPAGLACRDSTRIEAGLPLYGHELAGSLGISPVEAGFPGYVKYHKPFFIGRSALLACEANRQREIVRFRCDEKRTRRPKELDLLINEDKKQVGQVTSCSMDVEGNLVGLALVDRQLTSPGTGLTVCTAAGGSREDCLQINGQSVLPIAITVLTRFPEKDGLNPAWMAGED
jgi:glycine hydroxymethyltransferase